MKSILILGVGRSSMALITYLLKIGEKEKWHVTIADRSLHIAQNIVQKLGYGIAVQFDADDVAQSQVIIQNADVVVSLLPPSFHPIIAQWCLVHKKHMFTASYISKEMQDMHHEVASHQLLFMNECGLDPGLDHMASMQVIDHIKCSGGKLIGIESYAGGIIAPDTDTENPWRYKFTWNPHGVVTAGKGMAIFLQKKEHKCIPYSKLFQRIKHIHIPQHGDFVGYINRDSLRYIDIYDIPDVRTILRGTLRVKGFCASWDILVQLGCTDDTFTIKNVDHMTHRSFLNLFVPYSASKMLEEKIADQVGISSSDSRIERIKWLGLFDDEPIGSFSQSQGGTPARVLGHILSKKWTLKLEDKDMIVMWGRYVYECKGKEGSITSYMVSEGEGGGNTAMAKGVGLPLAIAVRLFMQGDIKERGVCLPTKKNIYKPVLSELKNYGMVMHEEQHGFAL